MSSKPLLALFAVALSCANACARPSSSSQRLDQASTTTITSAPLEAIVIEPAPVRSSEKVEAASEGYVPPPIPKREEPRGADRFSVIEAPNLARNLGLGDGGAPSTSSIAPPPTNVEEEPTPAPEPYERPSAADPTPWTGTER